MWVYRYVKFSERMSLDDLLHSLLEDFISATVPIQSSKIDIKMYV
jgi:hypothetical protein